MAEVDTSSYAKPAALPAQKSLMDQVQGYGAIQQQKQQIESSAIGIDKQKLDLVNQRFASIAPQMAMLIKKPDLTPDDVQGVLSSQLKAGVLDPKTYSQEMTELPRDPAKLRPYLEQKLMRGQEIVTALNWSHGQQGLLQTGNAQVPIVTSQRTGQVNSTGLPIANQPGPGQIEYDENGQQRYRGVQPSQSAPGMVAAPPPAPGVKLPVERPVMAPTGNITNSAIEGQSSNFKGNVVAANAEPPTFSDARPAAGPSPLQESGIKQYTADQENATNRMTAVKPAIQALKMMDGLRSGPGTEPFNKAVAFLKANGLIEIANDKDPTAIYQEVSKKLAQYVGGSPLSGRSDAGQALAEAGSPSVKNQINPALIKLTRDSIIMDRVQAARPNAYESKNMSEYGNHRSKFPQSIDERAFGLDLMPEPERVKLVDTMHNKYKKNPRDPEALKFFKSLDIAKKQGFFEQSGE